MNQVIRLRKAGVLKFPIAALLAVLAMPIQPAAAWEPTKAVEIVVPAGAGGASDQMARLVQGIVAKHGLMKSPIIVVLKGGSNGADGLMDVKSAKGEPHKLLIGLSSIYTIPFSSNLPFSWTDLTPVAMVAMDEFLLWVNSDTPYKTAKDYLDAVKAAPEKFKMGGTGSKREDHIITSDVEKNWGVKFTYIPYKSGGEAATQLVGKHTDSNVNNPSENISQWRAGQVRALCVFDSERLPLKNKVAGDLAWADIPTCKEAGVNVEYLMLRAFFLPSGVSKDQVAFYENLFKKVTATPEWKEYMEKNALKQIFLVGAEFENFLKKDEQKHKQAMEAAGFMAKK